jgi:hypothetical protein
MPCGPHEGPTAHIRSHHITFRSNQIKITAFQLLKRRCIRVLSTNWNNEADLTLLYGSLMAERLDRERSPKRRGKYPWHEWTDGDPWLIERGKDYIVPDQAFMSAARQYAERKGLQVRAESDPDGVVVQFEEPMPTTAKKKLKRPTRNETS